MNVVKGFVTIASLVNNTPGVVARLGELSPLANTYSRESGNYIHQDVPGFRLKTFKCEDSATEVKVTLSAAQVKQLLELTQFTYTYGSSINRPINPSDFLSDVAAQFNTQIAELFFGDLVDTGANCLPSWMSWKDPNTQDIYKIWLANIEFEEQYDEFEIIVVPPIANLNDFFGNYQTAVNLVNAMTPEQQSERINTAKGGYPESYLRSMNFDFVDMTNQSNRSKTTWTVLIYGKAGDNIDAIKDALHDHNLANSLYEEPTWKIIFPDMFSRTEFLLYPLWHKIAITNLTVLSSIYASMLNIKEVTEYLAQVLGVSETVAQAKGQIFPHDYKCLTVSVVPGDTNPANKSWLNVEFPDYIPVNTSSLDFNRMSVKTQQWVEKIQAGLMAAETATPFTTTPAGFRRIKRNNKFFLSLVYENVNYLIAFRSNVY